MPESAIGSEQPRTPQSETSLSGSLSERLDELRRDMASALETAGRETVGEVLKAVAAIDGAGAQADILLALLESGSGFASRAAFFLTRSGEIRGWASHGFGRSAAAIEVLKLDYGDAGWAELATGDGMVHLDGDGCAELCDRIDAAAASEGVLIPFVLRGTLGGALYADRLPGEEGIRTASLQLLTHAAAQALETAAFRTGASPALRTAGEPRQLAEGEAAGIPLWQAPEAAPVVPAAEPAAEEPSEPAPEVPEAVEAEPETEGPVVEPVADDEQERIVPAAEPEVSLPAEEEVVAEAEPVIPEPVIPEPAVESIELPEPADELGFETAEGVDIEPRPAELVEEPEPELEDTGADIWALEEDDEPTQVGLSSEPAEVPAPAPVVQEPPAVVGQETVRLDIARLQGQPGGSLPAGQGFQPPEPEPIVPPVAAPPPVADALAPEPAAPAPEPEAAPDLSEEPTTISPAPEAAASPVAYPPPVAEPEPEPRAEPPAGSTEVKPPTDLEGPGSAFAKAPPEEMTAGEDALHEEARRLARLLVSEIKLYNEEIIEEGRRNGDIYDRLKDDIDRSRQMYQERIDPRLQGKEDYFQQELVQRLAGGKESLLGM